MYQSAPSNLNTDSLNVNKLDWASKLIDIQERFDATIDEFKTRYIRAHMNTESDEAHAFLEESKDQLKAQTRDMKQLTQSIFSSIDQLNESTSDMMSDIDTRKKQVVTLKAGETRREAKERGSEIMLDDYTETYNMHYWACWKMVALLGLLVVAEHKSR